MVRAMCGAKLMERKRTGDLMEMLGLKETVVLMAKANGVRWYGHVLRRDDGHVLRKALEFEVRGKRKPGWPKKTWKMQVEKDSKSNVLEKKDAMNQARWRMGVREIAAGVNPATPVHRNKPGSKLVWWFWWLSLYSSSLLSTTMGASCALFFANDILSSLHLSLLILF